jgi:hypothetical protein
MITACSSSQQALKLIEKSKYEAALVKLNKALPKDSLNADLYYVYSLLYTDSAYTGYDIDSSYQYIQKALYDYRITDTKSRSRMLKIGIDSLSLIEQKLLNDSLAYIRAADSHSIDAYQAFLDQHPGAPQQDKAISRRNQLSFETASGLDTYEAYKSFMDTYPQAAEFRLAQERYNTLVFREKTRAGNLQSYLNFLEAFPDSPFRPQAERQILEITTASNEFAAYEAFIRDYPNSVHTSLAVNLLYHLYRDRYSATAFFSQYPKLPLLDSLKRASRLSKKVLAPVYEEEHYGLMDSEGKYAITTRYDLIPSVYLCDGVSGDIVHLAIVQDGETKHQLLTKSGELIEEFLLPAGRDQPPATLRQHVFDLGAGILLVKTEESKYRLLHHAGSQLLPHTEMPQPLDTAVLVPSPAVELSGQEKPRYQFIRFSVDGLWGLSTFNGRILLKPEYEEIDFLENFVSLRQNGKVAVTNRDRLLAVADQRPLELSFLYEDVSLLDSRHIIAYTDAYESVIDINLDIAVPLNKHNIIRKINGIAPQEQQWLLREDRMIAYVRNDSLLNRTASVYYLYNKQDEKQHAETYQRAFFSSNWIALRNKEKYSFIDLRRNGEMQEYDSVKLIGESFALLISKYADAKDSVKVLFSDGKALSLSSPETLNFLLLKSSASDPSATKEFLMIAPRSGKKEVWNRFGQKVLQENFDDLKLYEPGLFVIDQKGRKGLLDSLGNSLLSVKYQSISNYKDGVLAVFQNKKFGAYKYAGNIFISPAYESVLQTYGKPVYHPEDSSYSEIFIARKDGGFGLINQREEALTEFTFDEIRYWNDTAALVKQDGKWMLHRISRNMPYDKEQQYVLYSDIEEFNLMEETEEEKIFRIYRNGGYGVMSDQQGELLSPTYDDIRLLGSISDANSIFLAEKYVPEAKLYIVIHLNTSGDIIKRQALTSEQYDMVYCEE